MNEFTRFLDEARIQTLMGEDNENGRIFNHVLKPLIMAGQIFMTIGNDRIDFYVGGNRLLEYSGNGFKVNPKIFEKSNTSRMLKAEAVLGKKWEDSINEMIRQCYDYMSSKSEQAERKIMQAYLPVFDRKDKIFILDREIRINDGNGKKCDWLLYNTETRQIKFVEVKMDNNQGLVQKQNGSYDVIGQLDVYSKQYEENKERIIGQYKVHVDILNRLLGLSIPVPKSFLDTKAGLAIFRAVNGKEIVEKLIRRVNPFIGYYQPAISVGIEDIWKHFCD